MSRFSEFTVDGDRVTYSCRPEEAEECEKRLALLLLECARRAGLAAPRRASPAVP